MSWRAVSALLIVAVSGCYGQDISAGPIQIYLDSQWDAREVDAIRFGMERWENATGLDFFDFVGTYDDDEFSTEDLDDGRHVVYKIMEPNADTDYLEGVNLRRLGLSTENGDYLAGYGLHTDILLFWYNFSDEDISEDRMDYFYYLANLVTHESGHFLGLGHNSVACDASMMSPNSCAGVNALIEITDEDINQICFIYGYGC